jgi:hypothetical protein
MKLILSRKGFDATWGGCASPIFDDGSMLSLPIPDRASGIAYRDVCDAHGESIAPLVSQLSRGRVRGNHRVHLDPDLRSESLPRVDGWHPIFGQSGAAQTHLERHHVGRGDLFLFFGWFRRAEQRSGRYRFVAGAPNLHVIHGWMQVGEIVRVSATTAQQIPWASYHPHLSARRSFAHNTLYLASDWLGGAESRLKGAGTFSRFTPELCLTDMNPYVGRSVWRLPRWFAPNGRSPLSRHADSKRWSVVGDWARLRTVPIGQEFVLDLDAYPKAGDWLRALFRFAES